METGAKGTDEGRRFFGPVPFFYTLAAVTGLLVVVFGAVQYSYPWLIEYDGFFHIKFSSLLRETGFIDRLPWLQFTIHADSYRDHHLLFHYLLVPFTLGDLNQGGKLAATLFAVAMGLTIYYVYRGSKVAIAPLFALLTVIASGPFIYRMSLLRVQSLSLALLLLVFYFCMRRRYALVFALSVIFVWYYDAFPLLLIVAGAFAVAGWLLERQLNWRVVAAPLLGVVVGMVVNPYFPENVGSLVYNIYRTLFLDVQGVNLGSEWNPYGTWQLVTNSLPAFLVLGLTILALPLVKQLKTEEYAALFLNLIFLVLTLKARRFVEYWPVFAFLTAALILGRRVPARYLLTGLLVLLPFGVWNVKDAISMTRDAPPPTMYEGSANWLRNNTQEKDIVFNADWDDFPFLFFYNSWNYYIVGLDPMYMLTFDEAKYRLYQKITQGHLKDPSVPMVKEFGAHYVFLDKGHTKLFRRLAADPNASQVYEDDGGYVFRLVLAAADGADQSATASGH